MSCPQWQLHAWLGNLQVPLPVSAGRREAVTPLKCFIIALQMSAVARAELTLLALGPADNSKEIMLPVKASSSTGGVHGHQRLHLGQVSVATKDCTWARCTWARWIQQVWSTCSPGTAASCVCVYWFYPVLHRLSALTPLSFPVGLLLLPISLPALNGSFQPRFLWEAQVERLCVSGNSQSCMVHFKELMA